MDPTAKAILIGIAIVALTFSHVVYQINLGAMHKETMEKEELVQCLTLGGEWTVMRTIDGFSQSARVCLVKEGK